MKIEPKESKVEKIGCKSNAGFTEKTVKASNSTKSIQAKYLLAHWSSPALASTYTEILKNNYQVVFYFTCHPCPELRLYSFGVQRQQHTEIPQPSETEPQTILS